MNIAMNLALNNNGLTGPNPSVGCLIVKNSKIISYGETDYKKYKLLANAEAAEDSLERGDIHEAMDFIEDHLVCFYRFQTDQEIRQINNSEIVGIDPIMMDLIYKKKQKDNSDELKILSDIAELGILEFEALHSLFRIKWRNIDDALALS